MNQKERFKFKSLRGIVAGIQADTLGKEFALRPDDTAPVGLRLLLMVARGSSVKVAMSQDASSNDGPSGWRLLLLPHLSGRAGGLRA